MTIDLPLILLAAFIATASPGPATLAIAGTSLARGRSYGLALAAGVTTGSLTWSIAAALGLSALMRAHVWLFETLRYAGALYLLYLAWRSARAAIRPGAAADLRGASTGSHAATFLRGLGLHLTNPKAILFFGALYSVGAPADADIATLFGVVAAIGVQSFLVFHGYALLFSLAPAAAAYRRLRRGFEAAFALAFGAAGLKILTMRAG